MSIYLLKLSFFQQNSPFKCCFILVLFLFPVSHFVLEYHQHMNGTSVGIFSTCLFNHSSSSSLIPFTSYFFSNSSNFYLLYLILFQVYEYWYVISVVNKITGYSFYNSFLRCFLFLNPFSSFLFSKISFQSSIRPLYCIFTPKIPSFFTFCVCSEDTTHDN